MHIVTVGIPDDEVRDVVNQLDCPGCDKNLLPIGTQLDGGDACIIVWKDRRMEVGRVYSTRYDCPICPSGRTRRAA